MVLTQEKSSGYIIVRRITSSEDSLSGASGLPPGAGPPILGSKKLWGLDHNMVHSKNRVPQS